MAVLSVFDENSDVLVYTTESGHYCIMVNSARNIRLNDDGTLNATPIYGPFDNDTFVCEAWPEAKKKLANIAEAGYRVNWGSGLAAENDRLIRAYVDDGGQSTESYLVPIEYPAMPVQIGSIVFSQPTQSPRPAVVFGTGDWASMWMTRPPTVEDHPPGRELVWCVRGHPFNRPVLAMSNVGMRIGAGQFVFVEILVAGFYGQQASEYPWFKDLEWLGPLVIPI